jgi:hypothetical protein
MSNKRYIELYSADRNRSLYPNAAEFVVPFTNGGFNSTPQSAYDPITYGPVYYSWQGGSVNTNLIGWTKTGTKDSEVLLGDPSTGSLSSIPNFYAGCAIKIFEIVNETRTILSYIPSSSSIIPSIAFEGLTTSGGIIYIILDPSTGPQIYIPSVDGVGNTILNYSQAYNGYYIVDETASLASGSIVASKIISYDFITQMATLETPFPTIVITSNPNHFYTLRKTLPNMVANAVSSTSNTIVLSGTNTSSTDGAYVGQYIYLTAITTSAGVPNGFVASPLPSYINNIFLVTSYTGTTKTATIVPPQSGTLPTATLNYVANIVSFINDNASPLMYNGSLVSQNGDVCYEIALINLSLPNVVLKTGGRIAFYPFVYVEFSNHTSTGASNKIIYSNNPESSKALFIAPVTDISQPVNSTFLKIDSGAMTQTVKFKPNDSLKFSVYLPDGTLFQTFQQDYLSPYPPNTALQIDAIFSIKRL